MRDALRIFRRFLPPYKKLIGLNILFNILGALFGAFSIVSMIPILKILLKRSAETYSYQEANFSLFPLNIPTDALKNNLYYYVTDLAATQGPQKTLMLVGGILIVMTLLKTGFTFFASYTMVIIRNNVVRDIRNKMYRKIVALHLGFFSDEKKRRYYCAINRRRCRSGILCYAIVGYVYKESNHYCNYGNLDGYH
jgi:subfamily B ATP-binding cassette protein MsbA